MPSSNHSPRCSRHSHGNWFVPRSTSRWSRSPRPRSRPAPTPSSQHRSRGNAETRRPGIGSRRVYRREAPTWCSCGSTPHPGLCSHGWVRAARRATARSSTILLRGFARPTPRRRRAFRTSRWTPLRREGTRSSRFCASSLTAIAPPPRMRRAPRRDSMLVLGLNLGVDRSLRLDRLLPGHVQRPRSVEVTAGGKSVNVCRASRAHGVWPVLVANLPGRDGAFVGELLTAEGHDVRAVVTDGEARSQVIIIEDDLRITVLNEPGPPLSASDRDRLLAAFADELPGHRVATANGSLPPGAPDVTYGEVVALAHERGVIAVVDATREALSACLPFEPDVVTPNLAEAHSALHGAVDEAVEAVDDARAAAVAAARSLHEAGARAALVTAGRHGVGGADADGAFWVTAPSVHEVNPVGAGDSFVAGLAVALERGDDLRTGALCAVATGSASVASPLAGCVAPSLVAELARRVSVERV